MKIQYDRYIIAMKDGKEVKIPDPQFKTINKIIFKGPGLGDLIQYYGSDEELIDLTDFNEYGWEFIVGKEKYNSRFALDYLVNSRKEEIGYSLPDIEMASKTLFPTRVKEADLPEGELITDIHYFGTVTIGHQKLLMVNAPRGYLTAELWDTSDVVIEDGIEIPKILITFEDREIIYSKIVWFVITTGIEGQLNIEDINLTYFSWLHSINPHRKMNQYLLRNDEKAKIDARLSLVENLGQPDHWMDLSSGTLLANRKIENPLIYNEILKRVESSREWREYISYNKGDTAECGGKEYISLSSKNSGKKPDMNPTFWARKDKIDDFKTLSTPFQPYVYQYFPNMMPYDWSLDLVPNSAIVSPSRLVIPESFMEGLGELISISVLPQSNNVFESLFREDIIHNYDEPPYIDQKYLSGLGIDSFTYDGQTEELRPYDSTQIPTLNYKSWVDKKPITVNFYSRFLRGVNTNSDQRETIIGVQMKGRTCKVYYSLKYKTSDVGDTHFNWGGSTHRAAPYVDPESVAENINNWNFGKQEDKIVNLDNIINTPVNYGNLEIESITKNYQLYDETLDSISLDTSKYSDLRGNGTFDLSVEYDRPADIDFEILLKSKEYYLRVLEHYGILVSNEEQLVAPVIINGSSVLEEVVVPSIIDFVKGDGQTFTESETVSIQVQLEDGTWQEILNSLTKTVTGEEDSDITGGHEWVLNVGSDEGFLRISQLTKDTNLKIELL